MENIDSILQAILEGKKLKVPNDVVLEIIARVEFIEFNYKYEGEENGGFQNSLLDHDEE